MSGSGGAVLFLGDLDDPWVAGISDTISDLPGLRVRTCSADLPAPAGDPEPIPDLLIVHRSRLTLTDLVNLERWREVGGADGRPARPKVILCYGPHVRYAELERGARVATVLIPEATARETLLRQASQILGLEQEGISPALRRSRSVDILSGNRALRDTLAEGLSAMGFLARSVPDSRLDEAVLPEAGGRPGLLVWDVPVLEPGWADVMQRRARLAPVVALLGIADRALVEEASGSGASACLDMPLDLHDLAFVIDRLTAATADRRIPGVRRAEMGHEAPPAPASRGRWPVRESAPTIAMDQTTR